MVEWKRHFGWVLGSIAPGILPTCHGLRSGLRSWLAQARKLSGFQPYLAIESHWNGEALVDTFYISLSEEIKDRLASVNLPSSFKVVEELAVKVNNQLQDNSMGPLSTR